MTRSFSVFKRYRQLFFSVLFFALFSFSIHTFATTYVAPGSTLSPAASCTPGGCTTTPFGIGNQIYNATAGSVLFAGTSGVMAQDNSNLFWDNAANRLGIGTTAPAYALDVGSSGYSSNYVGTGTGADMHVSGTYTGTSNATYVVTVDGGNDTFSTPNTFQVEKNGVVIYSSFPMDGAPTLGPLSLGNGLSIGFDEGASYYSDHDTGDVWTITATTTGEINVASAYRTGGSFFATQDVDASNIFIGKDTYDISVTGTTNTYIGVSTGMATTTATGNTFIGSGVGNSVVTAGGNTFVGASAGASVTGSNNTLFGVSAGQNLTSGSANTFLGPAAGTNITTGSNNIFIGNSAAASSGGVTGSIAIGASSTVTASNQMVLGGASGVTDVYIGNGVTATTAGSVAINATGGSGSNKTGGSLTLAGGRGTGNGLGGSIIFQTSPSIASGSTAQTLTERARITTTGEFQLQVGAVIGNRAGHVTVPNGGLMLGDGWDVGSQSGCPCAPLVISRYWKYDNNDDVRGGAIFNYTLGAGSGGDVLAFAVAGDEGSSNNPINTAMVKMTIGASGKVGIGTDNPSDKLHVSGGELRVNSCVKNSGGSAIAGTCSSDERLKKDITSLTNILDRITQVQTATYHWKSDEYPEFGFGDQINYGLIAQQAEQYLPELVEQDGEKGFKAVHYERLPIFLLEAIKELNVKVEDISSLGGSGGTSAADYLANAADKFINGIVHVARLVVGSPEARTGITLYDEVTGEPYCLSVANGATKTAAGECAVIVPALPVPVSTPVDEPAAEEPAAETLSDDPTIENPPADTATPETEDAPTPEAPAPVETPPTDGVEA